MWTPATTVRLLSDCAPGTVHFNRSTHGRAWAPGSAVHLLPSDSQRDAAFGSA